MTAPTVTFSPAEQAALRGEGNPYPEEAAKGDTNAQGSDGRGVQDDQAAVKADNEGADAEQAEASPEAEGGDEAVEVADSTNPDGPPRRKMIAFGAYDKKRIEANKAKEEAAKLREQVAYLQGLAQQQPKPAQQTQQPQTEELSLTPPDKAKEPEKYLAWLEAAAAKALTIEQRNRQQSEQTDQFAKINQAVFDHEQAFINGDPTNEIEPHPDFHEAVKHLQNAHKAELRAAGYDANEIQQIMTARAQSVALKALQQGKSPAERVYELAKLAGYKKPSAKPAETEAEKIARQAKNQEKAGKTISSLPGGESKGGLTPEMLGNMDPKEFIKLWASGEAKKVIGFQ